MDWAAWRSRRISKSTSQARSQASVAVVEAIDAGPLLDATAAGQAMHGGHLRCAGRAVAFATGLKPFCTIYSPFLQRGYDRAVHDVDL